MKWSILIGWRGQVTLAGFTRTSVTLARTYRNACPTPWIMYQSLVVLRHPFSSVQLRGFVYSSIYSINLLTYSALVCGCCDSRRLHHWLLSVIDISCPQYCVHFLLFHRTIESGFFGILPRWQRKTLATRFLWLLQNSVRYFPNWFLAIFGFSVVMMVNDIWCTILVIWQY